jgi:hypothetical protein
MENYRLRVYKIEINSGGHSVGIVRLRTKATGFTARCAKTCAPHQGLRLINQFTFETLLTRKTCSESPFTIRRLKV